MNPTRRVISIDFGSTQSSIAVMEIGSNIKPELLNVGGGRNGQTVPTILALDKNDDTLIAAGNDVRQRYKQIADSSVHLVSDFKRYLGNEKPSKDDSPETIDTRKNAEKYAKIFLTEMVKIVENHYNIEHGKLDPNDFATCITYPASWSEDQVRLLKKIVADVGFPQEPEYGIYSLSEPEAAVHALRMGNELDFKFGNKPEYFMVIDFGGGTLDVCIIQTAILGRTPKIISTAGDPELGGRDFDDIIEKLFFKQNRDKISRDDLLESEKFELRDRIREAKEAAAEHFLYNQDHTHSFNLPSGQFNLSLIKSEFINMVKDCGIYDKITMCIKDAINKAGIRAEQITKVILTGGSSRWFFLREIVAKECALGGTETIFYTKTPFTDVAMGGAIAIGLTNQAPPKAGIWVRYRLSETEPWSEAKCLLAPNRENDSLGQTGEQFLGILPETRYVHPWRIYLSWWHGFEKDQLVRIGDAAIDVFTRSNYPFFERLRRIRDAILLKQINYYFKDDYKVYLKYAEDKSGACTYQFEVVDIHAAHFDEIMLTQGKEATKSLSKGRRIIGQIIPGFLSYQGLLGLRARKLIEWTPPVTRQVNTVKKKFYWPWE